MVRAAKHCTEIFIKASGIEDALVEINKLGVNVMESVINSGHYALCRFLVIKENGIYSGKQTQYNKAS